MSAEHKQLLWRYRFALTKVLSAALPRKILGLSGQREEQLTSAIPLVHECPGTICAGGLDVIFLSASFDIIH